MATDYYSLGYGMDPTPEERQRAIADALRKRQLGALGMLSGDRTIAPTGQTLLKEADDADSSLLKAGENRLHRETEAARNQALAQYHQDSIAARAAEEARRAKGTINPKETDDGTLLGVNNVTGETTELHKSDKKLGARLLGGRGGGVGGAPKWSPEEVDHWAAEYNAGKGVPPNAKGKAGQPLADAIAKRAHALDHNASAGSAASDFKADDSSLHHFQQQADSVGGFIGTFDKNVQVLQDVSSKLKSSNSPFLNKGMRWFQENAEGSPDLTAYRNALNTVTAELAKINSGSTGSGGAPISVLEEMKHGLPENATPGQILAALNVYRKDSENRRDAANEQISIIRGRRDSRGKPPAAAGPPPGAPAMTSGGAAPTHWLISPDKKQRIAAGPDGKPLPGAKPEPVPTHV